MFCLTTHYKHPIDKYVHTEKIFYEQLKKNFIYYRNIISIYSYY